MAVKAWASKAFFLLRLQRWPGVRRHGRVLAVYSCRGTVKKALTLPLPTVAAQTQGLAWALLLGELAAAALLLASGRLPLILLRSLQIFLRF